MRSLFFLYVACGKVLKSRALPIYSSRSRPTEVEDDADASGQIWHETLPQHQ